MSCIKSSSCCDKQFKFRIQSFCFFITFLFLSIQLYSQGPVDERWVKDNYTKREVYIPTRDGVKLYTAIYEPKSTARRHPILVVRTPYRCSPYGEEFTSELWNGFREFTERNYIIVYQNVRGKFMSEGEFENVRPVTTLTSKDGVDDASDMYDTAEWLLKNTHSNERIGVTGNSYPGFYSFVSALSLHPSIKAVCPQAPVLDWFMGDDIHHNGALMLTDSYSFLSSIGKVRSLPSPVERGVDVSRVIDEYTYFLKEGPIKKLTENLDGQIPFWTSLTEHPNYDNWWKERCPARYYKHIDAAVLVVGGLFDAEDCYGTWNSYRVMAEENKQAPLYLLIGPWKHGGWKGRGRTTIGDLTFGSENLNSKFHEMIAGFFDYYLLDEGDFNLSPKATIYFTGEGKWRTFSSWPVAEAKGKSLYLTEGGGISSKAPETTKSASVYVSTPQNPVPYTDNIWVKRNSNYMTGDQRFASRRPDVLTFTSEELTEDLTIAGPIDVDFWVSISTTDADFIVKVIDVFPDGYKPTDSNAILVNEEKSLASGYQFMVRGNILRGRYRNSFSSPKAFTPGKPERIQFSLEDVAHTFKKGHKLMIQVQSSWFPLVDINPQQFVNIYQCDAHDFVASKIRIYHQKDKPSQVKFSILE